MTNRSVVKIRKTKKKFAPPPATNPKVETMVREMRDD
jgi:hypothetical protein